MPIRIMAETLGIAATIVLGVVQTYIFYKMARDPAITGLDQVNAAFADLLTSDAVQQALNGDKAQRAAVATRVYVFLHLVSVFADELPKAWWRGVSGDRCDQLLDLLDGNDPVYQRLRKQFASRRAKAAPLRRRALCLLKAVAARGTKCLNRTSPPS